MMAKKVIDKIRDYALIIGIITGSVSFAWCKFVLPEIDNRIDSKQRPVIEALEFQNFLMMETMTDSAVLRAEKKYVASKRGRAQ